MERVPDLIVTARDGTELAADACLPSATGRFPVIVSADPYRKDDVSGAFNEYWRRYHAEHGYATVLVDCRGTGASRGEAADTATIAGEARDGYDIVEWAARQQWSTGAVAAWGMSYGGAFSLALAAQHPPHLRAITCAYGYADTYRDAVLPGGWPVCLGRLARESMMLAMSLAPPSRRDAAGRWREIWLERLEWLRANGPYSLEWLDHREEDEYWRARRTDVARIQVPALLIGGWRDIFPEPMARIYTELEVPKRMLFGPWLHVSPELSSREPIDWLHEVIRWWDRWLGERESPGAEAPRVICFAQGLNRWHAHDDWPPPQAKLASLDLRADRTLGAPDPDPSSTEYRCDPLVGVASGLWDPLGLGVGYPLDQTSDEVRSLHFTSAPLERSLWIVGSPQLQALIELDGAAEGVLVAKLSDVSPDGSSALITSGRGRVAQGVRTVEVRLSATSYVVASGHRLRLALAGADFPLLWPVPETGAIRVHHGGAECSRLWLGALDADQPEPELQPVDPSVDLSPWDRGGSPEWTIVRDLVDDSLAVTLGGSGRLALPDGTEFEMTNRATATVARERPAEAAFEARSQIVAVHEGSTTCVESISSHTLISMGFRGRVSVDDETVFEGEWRAP